MGAERCVHPQDPAKARWLTGSGALLSGLLLFLLLPPLLFSHMEGWSYVEGFYFAFITLSTVGFGDYVIGESPSGQRERGLRLRGLALPSPAPLAASPGYLPHTRPGGGLTPQDLGRLNPPSLCEEAKVTQPAGDNWSRNQPQAVGRPPGHLTSTGRASRVLGTHSHSWSSPDRGVPEPLPICPCPRSLLPTAPTL